MELVRKPDFEQTLNRFEAWWNCEVVDRPPVSMWVRPDSPIQFETKEHTSAKDGWFDVEGIVDRQEAFSTQGVFMGDSFPGFCPNLGPDLLATIFGAELEFAPDTSWSHPIVSTAEEVLSLKPNFDNPYWQKTMELMRVAAKRGKGKWITGYTDLHPNGDLLSALIGPETLCLECIENPDAVRAACEYITGPCIEAFDQMANELLADNETITTWTSALHRGRFYMASCDFAAMISADMFGDLILPSIRKECQAMDRVLYHLDGPTALQHLDLLLETPEIHGIQWVYGSGQEPAAKWIDVYKRIQKAGKSMQIICENGQDALNIASQIRPEGAWFSVGGGHSREEADALLKAITASFQH